MTRPAPAAPRTDAAPAQAVKKRGRETALDMIRSMGVVMLIVVPLWFLAQPPDSAEQEVREVDQSVDVQAWQAATDAAPAPVGLPEGWRPTVSRLSADGLTLGWLVPSGGYAELASTTGPAEPFVEELVGEQARRDGEVDVDGTSWQRWVDADGSVSLVRTQDGVTTVAGTRRESATDAEVLALARSVRP